MDTDGVQTGFDCALTRAVSRATQIPVIASGGAGKPEHFTRVLTEGEADAALAASVFHYGTYTVDDLKECLDRAGIPVRKTWASMIIPCIDLMDGKVVQLVQGREKALEGDSPEEMLRRFAAFPQIQVIDLDAAMGRGANDELVEMLAVESGHSRRRRRAHRGARAGAHRSGRVSRDRRHFGLHRRRPRSRISCRRSSMPSAASGSCSRSIRRADASS